MKQENPILAVVQEIKDKFGQDGFIPWTKVIHKNPQFKKRLNWDDSTPKNEKRSLARACYFLKRLNSLPARNGGSHQEAPPVRRKKQEAPRVRFCPCCGVNLELIERAIALAAKMKGGLQ